MVQMMDATNTTVNDSVVKSIQNIVQQEACSHDQSAEHNTIQDIITRLEEEVMKDSQNEVEASIIQNLEDNNDDDTVPPDEEYFFPTPEEVQQAKAPEVGMAFDSLEKVQRFVNVYGQLVGFSVIKGSNYKHRKITLQCNRSRKPKEPENKDKKRKRHAIERTDCAMKVRVVLEKGKWVITTVENQHNHELVSSPSLTKFFLKHRYMTGQEREFSRILQESRIKPIKIMAIFRKMSGNFKIMNFMKQDVVNLQQFDKRMKSMNSDIERAMEFVKRMQLEQPGFYWTMKIDEEGNTVRSMFWTDSRARLDYSLYGEFISFDTAYSTKKYNMLFAPIVGINGHGKTVVFGWALLEDQKATTFSWLLQAFLEVMGGKKPDVIMTDQDAAMKKAISDVLPEQIHRNCFWHIMRNGRENLRAYFLARPGMSTDLEKLIYDSLSEEEFEVGWTAMLDQYKAHENKYLQNMYSTRKSWVPVFLNKIFCPFIHSTVRSQSTNSIFKEYVMPKDSIETFLKQYEILQDEQHMNENKDRNESTVLRPIYSTMKPIERHSAQIYTKGIYEKFLAELKFSDAYSIEEVEKDKMYSLNLMMDYNEREIRRDMYIIAVEREENKFHCICSKFNRDGILCCHVLRLFTQLSIHTIPDNYIKKRWTKTWKECEVKKHKEVCIQNSGKDAKQTAVRYASMMTTSANICSEFSKDPNKSKRFMEELDKAVDKIENEFFTTAGVESSVV